MRSLMTKIYFDNNISNNYNAQRRKTIIAWTMIAVATLGLLLSVFFILSPKNNDGSGGISSYVGWDEAWSDRYEYTGKFQGGDGSASNPYLIHNAAAMARMAYEINHQNYSDTSRGKYYKLVANIDMSARRWDPVGRIDFGRYFQGEFDGNGYVISGLGMETRSGKNMARLAGMFGFAYGRAVFKNITLNNPFINVVKPADEGRIEDDGYKWDIYNGGGVSVGFVLGYAAEFTETIFDNITINSGRININNIADDGYDAGAILGTSATKGGFDGSLGDVSQNNQTTFKDINVVNTIINSAMSNNGYRRVSNMGGVVGRVGGAVTFNSIRVRGCDFISSNLTEALRIGGVVGRIPDPYMNYGFVTIEGVTITGTRFNARGAGIQNVGGVIGDIGVLQTITANRITVEDGIVFNVSASDAKTYKEIRVGGIVGVLYQDFSSPMWNSQNTFDLTDVVYWGDMILDGIAENSTKSVVAGALFGKVSYDNVSVTKAKIESNVSINGGYTRDFGGLVGYAYKSETYDKVSINFRDITAIGDIRTIGSSVKGDDSIGGAIGQHASSEKFMTLTNVKTSIVGAGTKLIGEGQLTSVNSSQEIIEPPVITQQPVAYSEIIQNETTATLSVSAKSVNSDDSVLSYQWYISDENSNRNGSPLGGQTSDTMTISSTNLGTKYYYVVVSNNLNGNKVGSTSDVAAIEVKPKPAQAPEIVQQPILKGILGNVLDIDNGLIIGDTARLEIVAKPPATADAASLTYQWFRNLSSSNVNGEAIEGARYQVYDVPTDKANEGTIFYYAEVTNTIFNGETATIATQPVSISVFMPDAPKVTQPPRLVEAFVGDRVTLSMTAYSDQDVVIQYQWYSTTTPSNVDNTKTLIEGATSPSLVFVPEEESTVYYFARATAFSQKGDELNFTDTSLSEVRITLKTAEKPIITDITATQIVVKNENITLSISVQAPDDSSTTRYQWYESALPTNGGGAPIDGATSYAITFNVGETTIGDRYFYVEIYNTLGANTNDSQKVYSDVITVTVVEKIGMSAAFLNGNLPYIIAMIGSAGVMFAAFVLLVRKSSQEV